MYTANSGTAAIITGNKQYMPKSGQSASLLQPSRKADTPTGLPQHLPLKYVGIITTNEFMGEVREPVYGSDASDTDTDVMGVRFSITAGA